MTDTSGQITNRKTMIAALVALISASAGGAAFLQKHHEPTLREVFLACEKGDLSGIACCEDVRLIDFTKGIEGLKSCGMVSPHDKDPLGYREKEQDDWDKQLKDLKP